VLLWRQAGLRKSRTFDFNLGRGAELGLQRKSARRALQNLEAAGLVTVKRPPGHNLEVTLLELDHDTGEKGGA
jgi:hypothetical protein